VSGRITRPCAVTAFQSGHQCSDCGRQPIEKGYAAPIWMTFSRRLNSKACVRKGEHGVLLSMPTKIIRTETTDSGEETERAIRS